MDGGYALLYNSAVEVFINFSGCEKLSKHYEMSFLFTQALPHLAPFAFPIPNSFCRE